MGEENKCFLCNRVCEADNHGSSQVVWFKCPSCGDYSVTVHAYGVQALSATDRAKISACTRERNTHGLAAFVLNGGSHDVDFIQRLCPTREVRDFQEILENVFPNRIQDRFDRALANLCVSTPAPGRAVQLDRQNDVVPFMMAETPDTAWFILDEMAALGYISKFDASTSTVGVTVRAAGMQRAQELESASVREKSSQAFIAMWFDASTGDMFCEGLTPAVRDCGFEPRRIDAKETNNKICDEIIAEIRRSRFVIADFTGQRGGVYYEAGFAQGLGIPVIWTCHKDCIGDLHFDTRQYAHIVWETAEDLRRKLTARIRATIPGAKHAEG